METIKRIIPYYKPYMKLFWADMFFATLVSLVDIAFPQIINITSKSLFLESVETILFWTPIVALIMLALYVVKMFSEYFICTYGHIMGAKMETDMRRDLFMKMHKLPMSYYDNSHTGDLASRTISDLFDISEICHHGPENLFLSIAKIIGALIILLTINVYLTLILFTLVILMALFSFFIRRHMKKAFMMMRTATANMNVSLLNSLGGIRVVRSFANEEKECADFERRNVEYFDTKKKSYKIVGRFIAGNGFLQGLQFVFVLFFGGLFIANGGITVTDLAVYVIYINVFINPVMILINFQETLEKGLSGFRRFLDILDTPTEITDKEDASTLSSFGTIKYNDVSFCYTDEMDVLNHVNITVNKGETIAFVGSSGGGKSTLVNLLLRFYDVKSGAITIDGIDIRDVTQESLHKAIGVVQQDTYLFNGTFYDNIAYGNLDASKEEVIEAAKNANIHDYIMSLPKGYDTDVGERGVRLSGGQKQRISIARVFLKNPPILVLDEATSALDNESERLVQQAMDKLAKGRTAIIIAHRLSTIKHADKIYVIANKTVAEEGHHDELLALNGVYANYYNMQFR